MNQLQEDLTEILRQKSTYLLPENLKKDVECLGVVGNAEMTKPTIETVNYLNDVTSETTGAKYTFVENNGVWGDTLYNANKNDSAVAKIIFDVLNDGDVYFDVHISKAVPASYKMFMLSKLDTELDNTTTVDDVAKIQKKWTEFSQWMPTEPTRIVYNNVTAGSHFIYVKAITTNYSMARGCQILIKPVASEQKINYIKIYNSYNEMYDDNTQLEGTLGTYKYNVADITNGCDIIYQYKENEWQPLSTENSIHINDSNGVATAVYVPDDGHMFDIEIRNQGPLTVGSNATAYVTLNKNEVAQQIGLSSDIIVEGNTVLGVEGTYSASGGETSSCVWYIQQEVELTPGLDIGQSGIMVEEGSDAAELKLDTSAFIPTEDGTELSEGDTIVLCYRDIENITLNFVGFKVDTIADESNPYYEEGMYYIIGTNLFRIYDFPLDNGGWEE